MSSSTSNSDPARCNRSAHRAFAGWVLAGLVLAWVVCFSVPWGGILISQEGHRRVGTKLGSDADFLVLGDSKAGPFSTDCMMPWLPSYRGAVFSADSVTPVFYLQTLRAIREANAEFAPPVVFVMVGANNLNANGLHASRDFAYFVQLPLADAYAFAVPNGAFLTFVEAVLSRLFPVYGQRINITHLYVGDRGATRCPDPDERSFAQTDGFRFSPSHRDPIADRNYFDIYRRSMYANYETSVVESAALEALLTMIGEWGGRPIVVLPPVTHEIRDLEHQVIGDAFDESVESIVTRLDVELFDLRDAQEFEFEDVNHLSKRGAYDLSRAIFWPVLKKAFPRPPHTRAETRAPQHTDGDQSLSRPS